MTIKNTTDIIVGGFKRLTRKRNRFSCSPESTHVWTDRTPIYTRVHEKGKTILLNHSVAKNRRIIIYINTYIYIVFTLYSTLPHFLNFAVKCKHVEALQRRQTNQST